MVRRSPGGERFLLPAAAAAGRPAPVGRAGSRTAVPEGGDTVLGDPLTRPVPDLVVLR
jgi:hypothetical protein